MEMQPAISAAAAFPPATTAAAPLCPAPLPLTHRRYISDLDLRLPDDIFLFGDPFDIPPNTFEKIVAAEGEDLLASYLDLDCFGTVDVNDLDQRYEEVDDSVGSGVWEAVRRSQSVDCLKGLPAKERKKIIQPKKAMSPDKLAELWIVDPKRAKRIMANRQSAARSKERKAHYVMELEKKVQSLQTQATTLSVQHSLFKRDTASLNVENAELRRELEFMEQQAQLRNALNEALESELERLKVATGETTNSDAYVVTVQQTAYRPAFSSNHHSRPLMPSETNHMPNSFPPSDLPKAKKPKFAKSKQALYPSFNQTNTFAMVAPPPQQSILDMPIATKIPQFHPLDTNFSTTCQPLYANATSQSLMLACANYPPRH